MFRSQRAKSYELPRIQYGAWDNPGVSMFATVEQEPLDNMMTQVKFLPRGTKDYDMEACPMKLDKSSPIRLLYRSVKYEVEEIANERNHEVQQMRREQEQEEQIAKALAAEKHREDVETSIRRQLHKNNAELRELVLEIKRANTALKVKNQLDISFQKRHEEREQNKKEGQTERERLRKELYEEAQALRNKAEIYRNQLISQIKENRRNNRAQHLAEVEEGRRQRAANEMQLSKELKDTAEAQWRHRVALKKSLDDFAELQKTIREANSVKPVKDVTILDALSEGTTSLIKKAVQRRIDCIDTRTSVSERLGFQLSELKHEIDAHQKLITDLLVREHNAKDDENHRNEQLEENTKKYRVRDYLLKQREEHEFYRKKADEFSKLIPHDDTCFMERQYRENLEQDKIRQELTRDSYNTMAAMIKNNAERRSQVVNKQRALLKHFADLQMKQDRLVADERMRMLRLEPASVLYAIRKGVLTSEEIAAFKLNRKT